MSLPSTDRGRWRALGGLARLGIATRESFAASEPAHQARPSGADMVADLLDGLWVLLLIVVVAVGAVSHQPWIMALGVMSTVAAMVARAWSRLSLEEVAYERRVSEDRLFPGDEFELTVTISNRKPLPIPWLRIRDEIPVELKAFAKEVSRSDRLDTMRLQKTVSMGRYERLRLRYRLRALRRGYIVFGPAILGSGDLFGLFRSRRSYGQRDAVIVYPRIVQLPELRLPSARPVGEAYTRARLWEDLNRPAGLREYEPGDSLKLVDWKATARFRQPLVRTHDHTVSHHLVMLVDVQTSAKAWEGYSGRLLERVVTAAASVGDRAVAQGYRLGMISNGVPLSKTGRMVIPPNSDPRQLGYLLEALAMVRPVAMGRIEAKVQAERAVLPFGSTVLAISAVLSDGFRETLEHLASRGHPAVALYVGDGKAPPSTARVEVRDVGDMFDTAPAAAEGQTADG